MVRNVLRSNLQNYISCSQVLILEIESLLHFLYVVWYCPKEIFHRIEWRIKMQINSAWIIFLIPEWLMLYRGQLYHQCKQAHHQDLVPNEYLHFHQC